MEKGILLLLGFFGGMITYRSKLLQKKNDYEMEAETNWAYMLIVYKWLKLKQNKKSVVEVLIKDNPSKIYICGKNKLSDRLVQELETYKEDILYEVCKAEENLKEKDAFIVLTEIENSKKNEQIFRSKGYEKIASIEDIILEMYE